MPTPTIMPLLTAVHLEDCSDTTHKIDDQCTSEQDTNTDNQNDWLLRWQPWATPTGVNIADDWSYLIRFFPNGNSRTEFLTIPVTNRITNEQGWVTYSFDKELRLFSKDSRGCSPYWDVIVVTENNDCPTKILDGKICQLTKSPEKQRALGTSRSDACAGGGGGGGGSQSGKTDPTPHA